MAVGIDEEDEDVSLFGCEGDRYTVVVDFVGIEVDFDVLSSSDILGLGVFGDGTNSQYKFSEFKGLHKIVVCTCIKSHRFVV